MALEALPWTTPGGADASGPEVEDWGAELAPLIPAEALKGMLPPPKPWAPGWGAPGFGFWGVRWPHHLLPEPPHWGADETSGLILERIAERMPACRVLPEVRLGPKGRVGRKPTTFQSLGSLTVDSAHGCGGLGSPVLPGTSSHPQPYRMGISISSFSLGAS